jgi:GxxExxY protein
MPIHCPVTVSRLDAEEFQAVDYRVMGHAFATRNDLGQFCDEGIYEADLAARLRKDGFRDVKTQIPITLTHRDFAKTYFLDLLADDALYELKADKNLSTEHEAQLLNYIFLLGLHRGKLLNFRPAKIQGQIVATSLTQETRRELTLLTDRWKDLTPNCERLRRMIYDLLRDWGAFLELGLYEVALIHFLGGASAVEQRIPFARDGLELGTQRMLILDQGVAFRLTAFAGRRDFVEQHLRRLLLLTGMRALQWINLNHAQIEFTTLFPN